jgi:Flp pilus assembly protein TadG
MKRGNRGQVLVFVALAIFVLLGFAALGIDVGSMYSVRHELQRSADAGALAGASAIRQSGKDCNDTTNIPDFEGRTTKQEAELRAIDFATRDDVATSRLNTVAGDIVTATCPDPVTNNPMRVRVDVQRTAPLFFARVLGRDTAAIPAFAVAEAFPVTSNLKCVVPWGIPAPWTNTAEPTTDNSYNPGDRVNWPIDENNCINKDITSWDLVNHMAGTPLSDIDQYLCNGSLQKLKIGDPQSSSISGNFFGIDFSSFVIPDADDCPADIVNGGANFYKFMIEHPCACELNIDLNAPLPPVPTEPGMMVGPTLKATAPDSYFKGGGGDIPGNADTDSLMNQDPTGYWDTSTNRPNSLNDAYKDDNWASSPRVIRIPVYNPDSTYNGGLNTPPGGSNPFQPLGFIGFWVTDVVYTTDPDTNKEIGTIVGRFVTVEGSGGGPEDSEGTVLDIRLVE